MEIRAADSRELRKMKRIYLEAFPRAERKPFLMMKKMARKGEMELLAVRDGDQMVGLAITVRHKDMILLDYFAMDKNCRGRNYGSRALQLLKERYREQRLILEIELADEQALNNRERVRRKQFYLRNGMQETGIHVMVFQVPMEVLTAGKPVTYEEYSELYRRTLGIFFAKKVWKIDETTEGKISSSLFGNLW